MFFILRSLGFSVKGKPRQNERPSQQSSLTITSSAFENYGNIPMRYTCEGEDVSPPLEISNVPEEAKSLILIMHDSDAKVPGGWTHWLLFNVKADFKVNIAERKIPEGAMQGTTSFGKPGYGGPCPPSGTYHYEFRIYAIDSELPLSEKATKHDLEHAMEGHVLASANLMGLYKKQNN